MSFPRILPRKKSRKLSLNGTQINTHHAFAQAGAVHSFLGYGSQQGDGASAAPSAALHITHNGSIITECQ